LWGLRWHLKPLTLGFEVLGLGLAIHTSRHGFSVLCGWLRLPGSNSVRICPAKLQLPLWLSRQVAAACWRLKLAISQPNDPPCVTPQVIFQSALTQRWCRIVSRTNTRDGFICDTFLRDEATVRRRCPHLPAPVHAAAVANACMHPGPNRCKNDLRAMDPCNKALLFAAAGPNLLAGRPV
jgi:hypothetical protein